MEGCVGGRSSSLRGAAVSLAALVACSGPALAQEAGSPTEVAQAFLDAVAGEEWDRAAALVHPGTASEYQHRLALAYRCAGGWPDSARRRSTLRERQPLLADPAEFEALSSTDVIARELELLAPYHSGASTTVVGYVEEGLWANVLYRMDHEFAETDPSRDTTYLRHVPYVLMLRRSDHGWRVGSFPDDSHYGPGVLPLLREDPCTRARGRQAGQPNG